MADANADSRAAAPAVPGDLAAKNKAALEKRKAAATAAKAAEAAKALPPGWIRVESRSRPGDFVYENVNTEERQAWFPNADAVEESAPPIASGVTSEKAAMIAKNKAALEARKKQAAAAQSALSTAELPAGWTRAQSKSRPGETVYENSVTGERQAWFPDAPCLDEASIAKQNLKDKNAKALAARKAAMAGAKSADAAAEAKKALPDGWTRVESRSRPGEFVYENKLTEERQAWFPDAPAAKPLPEGWRKVESRSYPGEFVYENVHTLERQAWVPTDAASTTEGKSVMPAAKQAEVAKEQEKETEKAFECQAKAVYDYVAANQDEEIDLKEGDIINVEYRAANGWWVGVSCRSGQSGIFPGTYVEVISK